MLDDLRMEDLEEFDVGAKIQRRQLLRVIKRAQENGVDVQDFPRAELLEYAKRVRHVQRERLKGIEGIDLSFLDKPLLDDELTSSEISDADRAPRASRATRNGDASPSSSSFTSASSSSKKSGDESSLTLILLVVLLAVAIVCVSDSDLSTFTGVVGKIKARTNSFLNMEATNAQLPPITTTPKSSVETFPKRPEEVSRHSHTSRDDRADSVARSSRDGGGRDASWETAKKCFSMAPSARRWKHEYSYPSDAIEHYEEILDATQPFRVQPFHTYAGYAGPWIENHWIFNFMGRPLDDFGPYIPLFVQWTDIVLWGKPKYTDIEEALLKVLRPGVMYVTVVQGAEGLKSVGDLFPNILVLSAGGHGHVPIPLLKGEVLPRAAPSSKRGSVISFVGKMLANRRKVIRPLEKMMGKEFTWYRGNEWETALADSHFALTPRGFGRTSFNVYEAIQLGIVPIYVWDDVEWLPYRGSENADWDNFALSVNARDVNKIPGMLRSLRNTIEDKRAKLRQLRDSHFTYKGVLRQIELFLKGGEASSDLRCARMSASAGTLSYGEGLEGIFGVLEISGDDLISFDEFYNGFKEFKVQSTSEPGLTITATFSVEEGRELWQIMDSDADNFIDYEEWMQNYPIANERMKEIILAHQKREEEEEV